MIDNVANCILRSLQTTSIINQYWHVCPQHHAHNYNQGIAYFESCPQNELTKLRVLLFAEFRDRVELPANSGVFKTKTNRFPRINTHGKESNTSWPTAFKIRHRVVLFVAHGKIEFYSRQMETPFFYQQPD